MTTLTRREFNQAIGRAKREASHGPVIITDRGKPALVLLSIQDFRRLTGNRRTLAEALAMPGVADIDFEPPRLRNLGNGVRRSARAGR